jgi:hypothetical protein
MSGKLAGFLRNNLIALIALFIALGGTSYAATMLPAGSVGTKQLKSGSVTAAKIKAGAVGTASIANNSVTGDKVLESSLGKVPSAADADTAANATKWGGVSSGALGTAAILSGFSFKPFAEGTAWTTSGVSITTPGSAAWFMAAVSLPQGAQVTAMTQYYNLIAAGDPGELDLIRIPASSQYGSLEVTIPSASVASGNGSHKVTPASPTVIDNTANSYILQWNCPGSGNAHLVSVKLEYTLP